MTDEELLQILGKGILAPSADNLQPWKFSVLPDKSQVDLFLDPERIKNFCDAGLRVPCISAGAVIENIRLEAACRGYDLDVAYLPAPRNSLHAASLLFRNGNPQPEFERSASEMRHTNRKFYQPRKSIPKAVSEGLIRRVSAYGGFKLHWLESGDPRYGTLTRLVGEADQLRFEAERLHRELYALIRWKPEEARRTGDGLDVRALEAGAGGTLLFKWIASWKRLAALNRIGVSRMFNQYARFQMKSSPGAGFIVAPSQHLADYVRGGELMQKVWFSLTQSGIAMQPMEALPIAILNLQVTGGEDWSQSQKEKLESLKKEFFSLFGLGDESGLIFLFRAGYAPEPAVKTLRRPLASFIQDSEITSGSNISGKGRC